MTAEGFSAGKSLKNVEIFKAGTYRGRTYVVNDLKKMVRNFNFLKKNNIFPNVPVRVDHSASAYDVAGYIEAVRVKGDKLLADMAITEEGVYKKIKRTTLRSRSIEIGEYEDNKGNVYSPVIYGVAWVDIPQVEGLAPVLAAAYGKDTKIINLNELTDMSKLNKEKFDKKEEIEEDEEDEEEDDDSKEDATEDEDEEDDKKEDEEDKEEDEEEDKEGDENKDGEDEEEKEEEDDDSKGGDEEEDDEDEEEENEDDKKEEEEDDDTESLVKELDTRIAGGEKGDFVDDSDFKKKFQKVIKMANSIKVGDIKKLLTSLKSVAKGLIDNGKYYSAGRVGELLASLESIVSSDSPTFSQEELKKKEDSEKWTKDYVNDLPDSSFAVIEPDFTAGKTKDKNCRHLPYKDKDGKVDLVHLRNALTELDQSEPVTDSISLQELKLKAKTVLTKMAKRYLKSTQFAKTVSNEKSGKFVQLRREDFDSLIRDSELADEFRHKTDEVKRENKRLTIQQFAKDGKTTPAMLEIEQELVSALSDEQMALYQKVKEATPTIVQLNKEHVANHDKKPSTEKSNSKEETEKVADDFVKRTDPISAPSEE